MKPLERITQIDLQREAVANSAARSTGVSLVESARIATRDARAHNLLAGLQPGHALHIASMGELSLHDVAGAIVAHYGPFACLTLSTWAASPEAIQRILALRQSGGVRRLEALVDSRMPTDCPEAHAMMAANFDLYRAGSNHSKVMAFTGGPTRWADPFDKPAYQYQEPGVAVVSTANLTRNPRCEVLVVTRETSIADFHAAWIREAITHAD